MPKSSVQAAQDLFVRRWGEMAASWGISRTMAEIHALLYLSTEPLCTDDVMEKLAVSRGSASMNLRELVNWGLIYRGHRKGDRKEYFEAEKDIWQMFETILRERRRREVQPIMETLQRCLTMIDTAGNGDGRTDGEAGAYRQRFRDMLEFCELMTTLANLVSERGQSGLQPLANSLGRTGV